MLKTNVSQTVHFYKLLTKIERKREEGRKEEREEEEGREGGRKEGRWVGRSDLLGSRVGQTVWVSHILKKASKQQSTSFPF